MYGEAYPGASYTLTDKNGSVTYHDTVNIDVQYWDSEYTQL